MYDTKNIGHAIAYCDVFMKAHDYGEYPQFDTLYKSIKILTDVEVINIIAETVQQSSIVGRALILNEMKHPDFRAYIRHKYRMSLR